jgi:hypothetical protein
VNQREKMLAVAVLVMVLALISNSMYGSYRRAVDNRTNAVAEAEARLDALDRKMRRGQRAIRQIEEWQARALPEDREKASSLYRAWLLDKAQHAGLEVDDIDLSIQPTGNRAYSAIGYKVKASGALSAVTALLYEFYRSPQLHQITRLQLSRPQGESKIAVSLDVEALSLPGAIPTDALPEGDPKRLKLANLDAYQKSLNDRDFVSAYKPPRPPGDATTRREPPKPPEFDDASQARFSGTVGPRDALQAWINVQTTGDTLHVTAGDPIKVGTLEGQIVSIDQRSLVYETEGKKYRVALGQMLRGGKEVEVEAAAQSEVPDGERRGSTPPG